MTTSRRSFLAAGAGGGLALTSGCLDVVFGGEPLEFDADRVAPADAALADADYDEHEIDQRSLDRTIGAGVERQVRGSFWTSTYTKRREYEGELRDASMFAAVSVPGMKALGRSVNPLDGLSSEELLEEILERVDGEYGSIENVTHEESFSLEILDAGREVDTFVGETVFESEPVDVDVTITSFNHEDDLIVLLGSHPDLLAEESANLEILMESVEHPV
ncbi:DUF6517 family protein [Natronococcus wangiae]|uniref:DUF6517 family protein n=1 Tax=Natronococcus wangiae TaxID=3068275 RepID=UPI00273D94C9|nr:DUF6517 family protein [Natronococcus sp. AD5]